MSRFSEYDGDGDDAYNGNGWAMWEKRAELALRGKRGRKALTELREALLALPEKRLIESALCTVGGEERILRDVPESDLARYGDHGDREELRNLVAQQGEGVCAIGAYVWFQKVKGGMTPDEAFAALPTIPSYDGGGDHETADIGKEAGLTYTLAWELASRNDETWSGLTPEKSWDAFMDWISKELARPPLKAPERGAKARRRAERAARRAERLAAEGRRTRTATASVGQLEAGL